MGMLQLCSCSQQYFLCLLLPITGIVTRKRERPARLAMVIGSAITISSVSQMDEATIPAFAAVLANLLMTAMQVKAAKATDMVVAAYALTAGAAVAAAAVAGVVADTIRAVLTTDMAQVQVKHAVLKAIPIHGANVLMRALTQIEMV
jgi:hypothetical protein